MEIRSLLGSRGAPFRRQGAHPGWAAVLAAMLAGAALFAACGSTAAGHDSSTSTTGSSPSSSSSAPGSSSASSTSGTSTSTSTAATTTTTTSPMQAPMTQPTASHPLTVLEIGDSLGEDLGFGLGDDIFASDPYVHVIQAAVGDTGLARPDYYNWPAHLAAELAQYHPNAVIVFIGGNDGQSFDVGDTYVGFGTALWHRVYSARVAHVMNESLAADARVLWVGMPIMQSPAFSGVMQQLNAIYSAEAAEHPGVTYFPSWSVFSSPSGQYEASVVVDGQSELLRDPDGVHIASYGGDLLAYDLVVPMERAWHIKLFPPGVRPPAP